MSVKSISSPIKDEIVVAYRAKTLNQLELAQFFNTSPRTINRILEERGLATPVARIKGEAYQAMQLLKQYGLTVGDLKTMLDKTSITKNAFVENYLLNASEEELGRLFWLANKAKIKQEMLKEATLEELPF